MRTRMRTGGQQESNARRALDCTRVRAALATSIHALRERGAVAAPAKAAGEDGACFVSGHAAYMLAASVHALCQQGGSLPKLQVRTVPACVMGMSGLLMCCLDLSRCCRRPLLLHS